MLSVKVEEISQGAMTIRERTRGLPGLDRTVVLILRSGQSVAVYCTGAQRHKKMDCSFTISLRSQSGTDGG